MELAEKIFLVLPEFEFTEGLKKEEDSRIS